MNDVEALRLNLMQDLTPIYPTDKAIRALNILLSYALKPHAKYRIQVLRPIVEGVLQGIYPDLGAFTSTKQLTAPMVSTLIRFLAADPDSEDWSLREPAKNLFQRLGQEAHSQAEAAASPAAPYVLHL